MNDSELTITITNKIGALPEPRCMRPVDTPHGVLVVHKETGIAAFVLTERSQMRNLKIAKAMVAEGLRAANFISPCLDQ